MGALLNEPEHIGTIMMKMRTKIDPSGQWREIFSRLAPQLWPAMDKAPRHVPCPVHGGKDGFRLFPDWQQTGGGVCNTCGAFKEGYALLAWANGWDSKQAFKAVQEYLRGLSPFDFASPPLWRPPLEEISNPMAERARALELQRLWDEAFPACVDQARPLRRYLENRGLSNVPIPDSIRLHPCLDYWQYGQKQGNFPAMLAQVCDIKGNNPVCLHRTFLTQDGQKAPVKCPKKLSKPLYKGALRGSAIRLQEPLDQLALTEGIETGLAVQMASGVPTWACVSAFGLVHIQLPQCVQTVYIMADRDKSQTGEHCGIRLAKRLLEEGRDARLIMPDASIPEGAKGIDWLDMLEGDQE